jgi:Flp pilus assembly pilin Flp
MLATLAESTVTPMSAPAQPSLGARIGRSVASGDPKRRWVREWGRSLVEYCLLVGLLALVVIGAVTAFGMSRDGLLDRSASSLAAL